MHKCPQTEIGSCRGDRRETWVLRWYPRMSDRRGWHDLTMRLISGVYIPFPLCLSFTIRTWVLWVELEERQAAAAAGSCFFHVTCYQLRAGQGSFHPVYLLRKAFASQPQKWWSFLGGPENGVIFLKPKVEWGNVHFPFTVIYSSSNWGKKCKESGEGKKAGRNNVSEHSTILPGSDWQEAKVLLRWHRRLSSMPKPEQKAFLWSLCCFILFVCQ